jgi:F-type H+/Na+-transporting ATPase subunit alpha
VFHELVQCSSFSNERNCWSLKLELAQYREIIGFAQFGSDSDDETKYLLKRGKLLTEILKQDKYHPLSLDSQILILFAGLYNYMDFLS